MKPLIIIPTHNEEENIESIIVNVSHVMQGYDYTILIVDDNSSDSTRKIIEDLDYPNTILMKRDKKLGLADAYIAGFKFALKNDFDPIIQMDADMSHNPRYLTTMLDLLRKNDVVIASRYVENAQIVGWNFLRSFISKFGSIYARFFLGTKIQDFTGGYNGWRRSTLEQINLDKIISKGYCFQIEMKYKASQNKARIKEFPYVFIDRKKGKSKMSKKIFLEALVNVIKIRYLK